MTAVPGTFSETLCVSKLGLRALITTFLSEKLIFELEVPVDNSHLL